MPAVTATTYLLTLPRFADQGAAAYRPGLGRMAALMDAMDAPHRAFPSVHLAGTNGKGSTASLLAAVGTASGRRIGLHTSPHLHTLGERLRLDGAPAPEAWLDAAVLRYRDVFDALRPSFFEATTALSFLYFAERAVDLAVVETGLGGRLDATNILEAETVRLAVITGIGLDHTDLLGDTLEQIAREKAGIIKPGVPVLTGVTQPGVFAAIREAAAGRDAPVHRVQDETTIHAANATLDGLTLDVTTPRRRYPALTVGLPGAHQETNALLALRAAERVFDGLTSAAVQTGLRDVRRLAGLRGRLEVLQASPLVVADVAHNPDGIAAALAFVQAQSRGGDLFVLLGLMRDKDAGAIAHLLAAAGATVFAVHLDGERALPDAALAEVLASHGVAVAGRGTVAEGLAWFARTAAPDDALLVTGSHQVAAQAL